MIYCKKRIHPLEVSNLKHIVTIQDITCLGKCASTVALPIISSMGVETSVIPTSLLSMHTAFDNFYAHDLTHCIPPIIERWKKENFQFDSIYTGYLGSLEQMDHISTLIHTFKTENTLVFMDPVLGDHGELYTGFDLNFAREMAKLCSKADIITPNLTEACLLLNRPYPDKTCSKEYIKELLVDLSQLGANTVILTSASFHPNQLGVMAYDAISGEFFEYFNEKVEKQFFGTGDIFASVCVGALTRGLPLKNALKLAVDFTSSSIEQTINDPDHRWYSVNFEQSIPMLVSRIQKEARN